MKMLAMLADWLSIPQVDADAARESREREALAEHNMRTALVSIREARESFDTRGHTPGNGRTLDDVLDSIDDADTAITEALGGIG